MKEKDKENLEENAEEKENSKTEKKIPRKELDKAYAALAEMKEKLEKAEADRDHWKNEYYKAYADTQNLRKSLEEDTRKAMRYRATGFIENLLPAMNAFYMAIDNPAPTPEARNYQIGFGYIYNQLSQALENEGVKEISPKIGDKFDLNTMHAVETEEREDVEEGTITKVLNKGYMLHDRLVAAAMVKVAAKKKETKPEEKEETPESPAEA